MNSRRKKKIHTRHFGIVCLIYINTVEKKELAKTKGKELNAPKKHTPMLYIL